MNGFTGGGAREASSYGNVRTRHGFSTRTVGAALLVTSVVSRMARKKGVDALPQLAASVLAGETREFPWRAIVGISEGAL